MNWDSPENSFLVRRAAVLGAPWAPLTSREYAPALGLVLPSDLARELGSYLAAIPDGVRDDDELIRAFCYERGVPLVAAVPHLLDHGDSPSVAGNDFHGLRRGVVLGPEAPLPAEYWLGARGMVHRLEVANEFRECLDVAVMFAASSALLRFPRAGKEEPHFHPFGWYWQDWCGLLGVNAGEIRAAAERFLGTAAAGPATGGAGPWQRVALEFWAACWLLGFDAGGKAGTGGETAASRHRNALVRAALASWLEAGLGAGDRSLDRAARSALVDVGTAAVRAGLRRGHG
ncbi:hypothetical protein [Streptomyces sp. 769]|uniref:hypothetical protein n=1 Tax=Streptomyces sp. 769 TaxID=1262452 RepID=UPI00058203B2|nr:hypothetical protein [Streptomyces sp. 769]AJC53646.1 hypothetical protein GZL_01042 [Streptomyces sp. 769]